MRSYALSVGLGSVVGDYSSRAYNRIYDSLSKLKGRAASYLSKFWYHVNIVGRLNEYERMIEETTAHQSQQLDELFEQAKALKASSNGISGRVGESEGQLTTLREITAMIGEIANSPNARNQLEKKRPVLEHLLSTLPKE